jgi:tRNA (guanine37-N1)-methyltransferase
MWQAEILTLFPAMVTGYLEASILGKARGRGLLRVEPRDIREHAEGKHR